MVDDSFACRWCGESIVRRVAHGAKARWIVNDPRSSHLTDLVLCSLCDLLYFSDGFTDEEMSRMYSGYRGNEYLNRRRAFEPWYTKKINDSIGHSEEVLLNRRSHLENMIRREIESARIPYPTRVLDVGGDEGQFVPHLDSVVASGVLEVSDVRPTGQTEIIPSWDAAKDFGPDLVMMCHVLEHTSEARQMILNAIDVLPVGGLLYVEVPLDRPSRIPQFMASRSQARFTTFIAKHPKLFVVSDLLSLVSRRVVGFPIYGSVIKQSEHINFFTYQSLVSVVTRLGLREISRSVYKPSSGVPVLDVSALGVLFEKSQNPNT